MKLAFIMLAGAALAIGAELPKRTAEPVDAKPRSAPARAVPPPPVAKRPVNNAAIRDQATRSAAKPNYRPARTAEPFNAPRSRSTNPAVVSGIVEPARKSTGTLDGRQVHRRP